MGGFMRFLSHRTLSRNFALHTSKCQDPACIKTQIPRHAAERSWTLQNILHEWSMENFVPCTSTCSSVWRPSLRAISLRHILVQASGVAQDMMYSVHNIVDTAPYNTALGVS